MEQIKNYLSRVGELGKVLVIADSVSMRKFAESFQTSRFKVMNVNELLNIKDDCISGYSTLIIDKGCSDVVCAISWNDVIRVIGIFDKGEDYIDIWEKFHKEGVEYYLVRSREIDKGLNPADFSEYEILENRAQEIELSVVLPMYNVSKYLPKCLETLLEWKAPYVEYIFVNDGSPDDSRDVIVRAAQSDSRVVLVDKENGGCASARNAGLARAKGRYIGFVDPDDFIDPSMFRKLLHRALMGNYELSYCGYKEYYEDTKTSKDILNDCLKNPYLTGTYRIDHVQKLAINTRVAIWRCIFHRDVLERKNILFHEDLKRFDDLPFRVECIFTARSAVCVPEYLYYYRLGREGQDVSCTDDRLYVHFHIFKYLWKFVKPMNDRRLLDYLQIIMLNTHGYAIERIDKKYYRDYLRKSMKQLNANAGFIRSISLMFIYGGKGNLVWYIRGKL